MCIINFENVSYKYPQADNFALNEINLSVKKGEILAIMGKSGSGKTTFCKLINGIIPHFCGGQLTGTVSVDGIFTKKSSVAALSLLAGLALDDPDAQLFTSSVRNEAAFGPENLLVAVQEIEERVNESLSAVGLAGFEARLPSTLSGGEKQRLVIASLLAMKNKILVLDEPLSRLDPDGALKVMSVIRDVSERYGITIIITSHESKMMQKFADRVCILNKGKIDICDTAEKILADGKLLGENGIEPPQDNDIQNFFIKSPVIAGEAFAIKLKDFSFYFDDNLLFKNINLVINDNDFTAIIGHNGSGKTTLLKIIAGLLRPYGGDVFIRGRNTKDMSVSAISKEAGFVMQNPDNQLFTDSVYKEVVFAIKKAGLSKKEIDERMEEVLNAVGLQDKDAFPHALSRSCRTKVVIAAVLAMGCKILLFDEIDVGQDYKSCIQIMETAKELHSKGYTIIFVTHNISLVCKYAHRLISIEKDGIITEWSRKKQ